MLNAKMFIAPNPRAGRPSLVGYLRLLVRCILSVVSGLPEVLNLTLVEVILIRSEK
jgi:hypothetical protein